MRCISAAFSGLAGQAVQEAMDALLALGFSAREVEVSLVDDVAHGSSDTQAIGYFSLEALVGSRPGSYRGGCVMIEPDRLITAESQPQEVDQDPVIRPKQLSEYIGQAQVISQLSVFLEAAKARGEALDHVLIFGPPGLGKTTLAHVIAQ